ncbi:MAG: HAMP domain-containing histidine kinase [Acidimicrobiia bacterium]|nr:HAMP domain-containing histidine kinase [Acidimicrobiia bacterium]
MTTSQTSPTGTDRTGTDRTGTDRTEGLAYALSHDLRARLRAAGGFLELARVDLHESADAAYFLDRAAAAVGLADRMAERLVRYLRIGPVGAITATDVEELVREAADRRPDGPETIIDVLPGVMADGSLLAIAVAEILDNATRYRAEDRPPVVRVTGTTEGPWTVIRFVDNGFGIIADRVDRAFEFFRQVHRVGENPGSGMGLPIARRSIEDQGGTITLGPGPDGGAVVEIRLPTPPGS